MSRRQTAVPPKRRGGEDAGEYHSPVGSPSSSVNSDFFDVRNDNMESSAELSGKFYSPRPSPVKAMLSDDSDELRNNGYYSPIPSPVAGARSPQNDDVIHGSSSFERRAELADINNRDYSSTDESAALIKDKNTRVYLRRWYVLFVFSLGCAVTVSG